MLNTGDLLPRFDAAAVDGRAVPYEQLWQHRNIVLFAIPAELAGAASSYLRALDSRLAALRPSDTSLVISDHVDGLPSKSVAIADRWGEIVHIEPLPADRAAWPPGDDILEWVDFIRMKCEECPP
jgi:hypothetical protein